MEEPNTVVSIVFLKSNWECSLQVAREGGRRLRDELAPEHVASIPDALGGDLDLDSLFLCSRYTACQPCSASSAILSNILAGFLYALPSVYQDEAVSP